MSDTVQYVLCDSPSTVDYAMQILWRSPFLILDCEGNSLGRAGGSISLICVGTPLAEHIFIFDTLSPTLNPRDFQLLWQLFLNPRIIKVVWDGRMDYLEIWSTFGVSLEGVLDLQVVEVVSRMTLRGEGELERLERLTHAGFSSLAVWNHIPQYVDLHAVIGLVKCCRDSGFGDEYSKDPEVTRMHKDRKGELWMHRPLTEQLLQYAAKDIQLISTLCTHFIQRGWVPYDPTSYNNLLRQCARYVSAHREQGKSSEEDAFRPTAIMPLDVLREPRGILCKCAACNRSLSLHCFQLSTDTYRRTVRRPRCMLCHVLALRHKVGVDKGWILA